ncbi:protein-export membrane protein SecF [Natranaerobius thermophilus JW/NM-WN-LF]|uniref:Protein-export membrane protein SecF n=2 Tax=Natranaerobius TaxID=375928 RepID=B2A264_NATTJ|nr:protein-export membrane protein SecF [Natranaerobius thermophilus JW/NM-WN-LF]
MEYKGVRAMEIITNRKIWFIVSLVILVIGLGSLMFNGLNVGIDFTGGTLLHIKIGEDYQVSEVRDIMGEHGLEDSVIQEAGGDEAEEREVIIRTVSLNEEARNEIIDSFRDSWPESEVLRTDNVGGTIGSELRSEAFWALLIASLGMIAFISYRFEYRFALAAIAAIIHDAFIVLAVFSIFQIEINEPFIAAILTIIGYSVNDTIVVFDRIRETLKFEKKLTLFETIQISIKRTLKRSLCTSITTLLVLISLFIFAGVTIRPLIIALLIGVISGTYSSIFVAANVWSILTEKLAPGLSQKNKQTA